MGKRINKTISTLPIIILKTSLIEEIKSPIYIVFLPCIKKK